MGSGSAFEPFPPRLRFFTVEDVTGAFRGGVDGDGDGMPNAWEELFGFDPVNPTGAVEDTDRDGKTNLSEFLSGGDGGLWRFANLGSSRGQDRRGNIRNWGVTRRNRAGSARAGSRWARAMISVGQDW